MHGRDIIAVLAFVILAAMLLISCGRHNSRVPGKTLLPHDQSQQQPQDDSANSGPVPDVMRLDAMVGAMRSVSAESTVSTQGWQAFLDGTTGTTGTSQYNVESAGTALTLRAFAPGEYAYAVYGQEIGLVPKPLKTLVNSEACKLGGGRDDEVPLSYYIGIADYTVGAWRWFGPFGAEDVLITVNSEGLKSRFKSPSDNFYMCVLASNGSKAASALPEEGYTAPLPFDPSERSASDEGDDPGGLTIEEITTWVADNLYTEPAVVTGLQAAADEAGITLTWDKNIDPDVFLYQILRSDLPAPGILTTVTPTAQQPSFTDTTSTPGKSTTYSVRARNDAGFGGSSIISAIRKLGTPNVGASDGDYPNHINVTWSQIEGAVSYNIYRADQPNGVKALVRTSFDLVPPLAWSDYTIVPEQTYYYFVQAVGEDEEGPISLPNGGFTIVLNPVELLATDGEYPDSVKLVWGEEPSAERYHIYRSTDDTMADAVMIQDLPFTVLTWSDTPSTGSPWGTPRYYFVKPYTGLTEGPAGDGDYGFRALAMPANVAATQGTNAAHTTVSWDAVNYATRYKVFRSSSPIDPSPSEVGEVAAPLTSFNDAAPGWSGTEGVHFYYYVCALHAGPDTERSTASASAEGWRGIGIPQNVSATDGAHTDRVTISWDAVSQSESYNIYRDSSYLDAVPSGMTTYDDTTAVGGVTYSYTVSAWAPDGEGAQSPADAGHVNIAPVAQMTSNPDPAEGEPPLTVEFNANASSDADGTIVRYDWDWEGDGTYDVNDGLAVESYEYVFGGEYTCTLRVWDDHGATTMAVISVTTNASAWAHTWGGSAVDKAQAIAVDDNGNSYVAGTTKSFGAGVEDMLLIKYSPNGSFLWQKTWGTLFRDEAWGVITDAQNNVIVGGCGYIEGSSGRNFRILLKYSPDGTLLWQKAYSRISYSDNILALCTDNSGNIYAAGSQDVGLDVLITKFSPEGSCLWTKLWGGEYFEQVGAIAVDSSANVYIVGATESFGEGNWDGLILKLDTDGNMLWKKTWGGTEDDRLWAVGIDGDGNVYAAGYKYSFNPKDMVILKYASDGTLLWQKGCGYYETDCLFYPNAISVDSSDNVYVTGYGNLNNPVYSVFLFQYAPDGTLVWNKIWQGDTGVNSDGLALTIKGAVPYLAGYTANAQGSWVNWDGLTSYTSEGLENIALGTESSPAITESTPSGTDDSDSGTFDTGGGGDDLLVMRVNTSGW